MKVIYRPAALRTIFNAVASVESKNTIGSGARWAEKFAEHILLLAKSKAKFALCKDPSLARYKYSCYTYKGWVIAFRVTPKKFEVCRIIWGAYLNY